MNYESTMKLATEFCLDNKGTVDYVKNTLLPNLEKELEDVNDCDRQHLECGLESYLSDKKEELIGVIAKCKERLALCLQTKR